MAYLYQVSLNRDPNNPALYDSIRCCKIIQRTRTENKKESFFLCSYNVDGRIRWKRAGINEGEPYGRYFAFWLEHRDDEKAIEILKKIFIEKQQNRKQRIKEEAGKLYWENDYIFNLDKYSIEYR